MSARTTPLVSILIPVYQAERWIKTTVLSAQNQTWPKIEIVVVDDGSTDQSVEVIQSVATKSVKLILQENSGTGSARNRALSACNGDFIQYLDADDTIAPDKIELQMERLSRAVKGSIASSEWGRFYDEPQNASFKPDSLWTEMKPIDFLISSWTMGAMMPDNAWLIPREIVERAGRWNETLRRNVDGEYFTRILMAAENVAFCAGAFSFYRSGVPGSVSSVQSEAALMSAFESLKLSSEHVLKSEDSRRVRRAIAQRYQTLLFEVYPRFPELVEEAEARVREFGGSDLKPQGGLLFRLTSILLGWKNAIQIRNAVRFAF